MRVNRLLATGIVACAVAALSFAASSTRVAVLVREEWRFPDGGLDQYAVTVWDETLTRQASRTLFDAARADPVEKTTYAWKGNLLVSETTTDAAGRILTVKTYDYDSLGRLGYEALKDGKGKVRWASRYSYDSYGRRSQWMALDGNGAVIARTNYVYDESGRRVLAEVFDATGTKAVSIRDLSDAAGRLVERVTVSAMTGLTVSVERWSYEGDSPWPSENTETRGDALVLRKTWTRDAEGNALKMTVFGSGGAIREVRTYQYAFRETASGK